MIDGIGLSNKTKRLNGKSRAKEELIICHLHKSSNRYYCSTTWVYLFTAFYYVLKYLNHYVMIYLPENLLAIAYLPSVLPDCHQ